MRSTMDQTLIRIASVMAERGTCSRAHVGAVVARNGRIISTGYNGAPAGLPHCAHTCACAPAGGLAPNVDHWPSCPAVQPCTISVHAEANAIAFAARAGVATEGTDMYVTMSPCVQCARLIINAGIARVRVY